MSDRIIRQDASVRRPFSRPHLHLLLILALLLPLAWLSLSTLQFYLTDTGLRFLQVRELIDHGWQTFAIDYDARPIDPELRHVPYYQAYLLIGGEMYLAITPFLPLAASFFFALFGPPGLAVVPVLGGLLVAAAAYYLARLGGLRRPILFMWASLFATPLLFYVMELWDHITATALVLWGIVFIVRGIKTRQGRFTLIGGVLLGLSIGERGETIILAGALGLSLLLTHPRWRTILAYGGGLLAGLAPVSLLNWLWYGHPLGATLAPRLFKYGVADYYGFRHVWQNAEGVVSSSMTFAGQMLFYIFPNAPLTLIAVLLVFMGAVPLIFALRLPHWRKPAVIYAATALTVAGYAIWLLFRGDVSLIGLFTVFPLFAFTLSFATGNQSSVHLRAVRFIAIGTSLFVALSIILTAMGIGSLGGDQWGARYLVYAYPSLLFMAFYAYESVIESTQQSVKHALTLSFIALLLLSIAFQFRGARQMLTVKLEHHLPISRHLETLPEVIMTNVMGIPSLFSSHEDKIFLWVNNEEDVSKLAQRLADCRIDRFALVQIVNEDRERIDVPQQVNGMAIRATGRETYTIDGVRASDNVDLTNCPASWPEP